MRNSPSQPASQLQPEVFNTVGTLLSTSCDAGVDIDQIADAAGHINSTVTKTVYRHVFADKLASAASVMDSTFRTAGGAS